MPRRKRRRYLKEKRYAPTDWDRELVRVVSSNNGRSEETDMEWNFKLFREIKCMPLVQAYVLKQMAVSARGKIADLRYNRHSIDFDQTKCQQDQKYWKYLNPILLKMDSSSLRKNGLNSLFHFTEPDTPTALTLCEMAVQMEQYMDDILENKLANPWIHESTVHQTPQPPRRYSHNHIYPGYCDRCTRHPQFFNVDMPCKRQEVFCGEHEIRTMSIDAIYIIIKLKKLFTRVRKLAHHLSLNSLQRLMPNLPFDVIQTIRQNYLDHQFQGPDIFENVTQQEIFVDLHHHIAAIAARFKQVILGRPTQEDQHFYHDSGKYEHFHALLCCRLSKFAYVKFHSLPKSMRFDCDLMGDNHRLLTLYANMKIANRCVTLLNGNRYKTFHGLDRQVAKVIAANKKRIARAEKRINDRRCWINYPVNVTKLTHAGNIERANQIERFSTYFSGLFLGVQIS